jgi:hypothetical protein
MDFISLEAFACPQGKTAAVADSIKACTTTPTPSVNRILRTPGCPLRRVFEMEGVSVDIRESLFLMKRISLPLSVLARGCEIDSGAS